MSIEKIGYDHEPATSGGHFLKITDGFGAKFRIVDGPYHHVATFAGDDGKPPRRSDRYTWGVVACVIESKACDPKAMIFEASPTVFAMIKSYANDADWGDPVGFHVSVKRTGTGLNTKYNIIPSPKSPPAKDLAVWKESGLDVAKIVAEAQVESDLKAEVADDGYDAFADE